MNLPLEAQIPLGLSLGRALRVPASFKRVNKILFCGMGGSAISGDILREITSEHTRLLFHVSRTVTLPAWVDQKTLVILSSYSGNTREILEVYRQVRSPLLVVTSGGTLGKLAKQNRILIPAGLLPRNAIGLLTFSVLPILETIGKFKIPAAEIKEVIQVISKTRHMPHVHHIAKQLHGKSIFLYGTGSVMEPALLRFRAQLEENAKQIASHHELPEMFHNEIEGWTPGGFPNPSAAIFLVDPKENGVFKRKRQFVQRKLNQNKVSVIELSSRGKGSLTRLFSIIALADEISLSLARLKKVKPEPTPLLDAVKRVE
jgi:glucose/mannose-6-phosphate isomerase